MFGLEALVKRELIALGLQPEVVQPGSLAFEADHLAMCRANIQLRTAERVLLCLGRFPASDFDQLFEQTQALPWHEWIPPTGSFPVSGKSVKSQLSSVPACQRTVKKAIVEQLMSAHGVAVLDESGPKYAVEVGLLNDVATLTVDTTGDGLHKRGYRPLTGAAPLRETLAAALVTLSFWQIERPLIDPFCGTGTIPIEAALIARRIAPGIRRSFAAELWPGLDSRSWEQAREEARDLVLPNSPSHILGTDIDGRALNMARQHAESAGVAQHIHFQRRSFSELSSKRQYGCVVCNPPYGHRVGTQDEVDALYADMPLILRRLPTWSHFVLTSHPQFENVVGQPADRRRKLYNGRIECQYYQFHGPRPPAENRQGASDTVDGQSQAESTSASEVQASEQPRRQRTSSEPAETSDTPTDAPKLTRKPLNSGAPVFGGFEEAATRQAEEFRNRLLKRARHLRRWPGRGVSCYRLYERDVPEIPLVVDRYEDHLHISEFVRPHNRTRAQHADWLDMMIQTAATTLEVDRSNVFVKARDRQRGASQYQRMGSEARIIEITEGGLRFLVNLSDYLDTGLFLDHRLTRQMVREQSANKRMINLFGYTGSFSVYAAEGAAASTTTVDSSQRYLAWAQENLALNGFDLPSHRLVRSDAMDYLRDLHDDTRFDLAVVDPPTYSNNKDRSRDWDVQRDHVELLRRLTNHMTPNGLILFSTNFRRFKLATEELPHLNCHEISKQTIPPDFRNRRIHRCWRIELADAAS
jgi:23S rRNA (guanine2445-N2)-methyltransferase / 23S rRNA (guanine2069-N7)-methyltransferase